MYAYETHARGVHAREVPVHEMNAREVLAYKIHAHKVQAHEMHAHETPAYGMHTGEIYTREIYAHRSVAFLGSMAVRVLQRCVPEPRYLHSPAKTTSTRFIKHNEHPQPSPQTECSRFT